MTWLLQLPMWSSYEGSLTVPVLLFHTALFWLGSMQPRGQARWGWSSWERRCTVHCTVRGLFSSGRTSGNLPFSGAVVTPWRLALLPLAGSADPAGRVDHLCLGRQLPFCPLAPGMRVPARPRTRSCLSCRLCDLRSHPRMQADKCRTAAEVSKRSWWSSPRCGARMQPRAREAESLGPVLVREAGPWGFCCLPHSAFIACACFVPSGPWSDSKLACLQRALFSVSSFRFDLGSAFWFFFRRKDRLKSCGWMWFPRGFFVYTTTAYCSKLSHLAALLPHVNLGGAL